MVLVLHLSFEPRGKRSAHNPNMVLVDPHRHPVMAVKRAFLEDGAGDPSHRQASYPRPLFPVLMEVLCRGEQSPLASGSLSQESCNFAEHSPAY
eukprot:5912617-Amphidinium_carterae.1